MAVSTSNFSVREFACPHCRRIEIAQHLIELCQKIRDYVNMPIYVSSGFRCKYYNGLVSKVENSYHTQGLAADLVCSIGAKALFNAIKELYTLGQIPELSFCYLYTRKNFVHVDIGKVRKHGVFQVHD